jgi:hypothetical protein
MTQLFFIAGLATVFSIGGGTSTKAAHGEPCLKLQRDCLTTYDACSVWETHAAVKICGDLQPNPLSAVAKPGQTWPNACFLGCQQAQKEGWCKSGPGEACKEDA